MPRKLIPIEVFSARRNAQMRAEEERICQEMAEDLGSLDDEPITSVEDLTSLGLPVLAIIPNFSEDEEK